MRVPNGLLATILVLGFAGTTYAGSLKYDLDKDGTLDLAEMEAAAGAAFDRLDRDRDATLDYSEAKGRVDKNAFLAADPDHDTTLTKEEYIQMAERLFKAADANNEGTLDTRELRSRAGLALQRLLQ